MQRRGHGQDLQATIGKFHEPIARQGEIVFLVPVPLFWEQRRHLPSRLRSMPVSLRPRANLGPKGVLGNHQLALDTNAVIIISHESKDDKRKRSFKSNPDDLSSSDCSSETRQTG